MTLAPSSAPTRCATRRRAVGRAVANPAGAGKWMPSPRHRGGACAPRPYACRRASRHDGWIRPTAEFDGVFGLASDGFKVFFAQANEVRLDVFTDGSSFQTVIGLPSIAIDVESDGKFDFDGFAHGVCVGWWLGVDCFGEGHVVLFAQGLGIVLIGEATEDFGAFESTNDNPMGAVVVEYRHLTADGLGFGAVCSHYADSISRGLESVNRFFKKKCDFFGRWESGTYGGFYRDGRTV